MRELGTDKVYAEKHLKNGLSEKSVVLLGEQYGGSMLGGND